MAESKSRQSRLFVLSQRSDFLYILKNGRRIHPSPWLLMGFVTNPEGSFRCGWTLPRQVGSAVVRNRLKRWSRVYFRERVKAGDLLPIDLNLVFRKTEDDFYKKLSYERFASVVDKGWHVLSERVTERSAKVRPS